MCRNETRFHEEILHRAGSRFEADSELRKKYEGSKQLHNMINILFSALLSWLRILLKKFCGKDAPSVTVTA